MVADLFQSFIVSTSLRGYEFPRTMRGNEGTKSKGKSFGIVGGGNVKRWSV